MENINDKLMEKLQILLNCISSQKIKYTILSGKNVHIVKDWVLTNEPSALIIENVESGIHFTEYKNHLDQLIKETANYDKVYIITQSYEFLEALVKHLYFDGLNLNYVNLYKCKNDTFKLYLYGYADFVYYIHNEFEIR
jgi:hypothetical protein